MTIALRPLNTLDPEAVNQQLAETKQRIVEDNPTMDLRRGPFFDYLAYYHAMLAAGQQANIADYLSARSLLQIEADPTLADPALVDDVLSNYRLTRLAGSTATGDVTIIVSSNITVTIGVGTVFQGNGQLFTAAETFTAKADAAQINSSGDRLLIAVGNGRYAFTITVNAVAEGPASELNKDTTIIPTSLPSGYVTSFAASDFTGGVLSETNAALIERLQLGMATRDLSNRTTMTALLRNTPEFSRFVASSIVGYGDAEMLRDRHTIFPVSAGGRVDWYVRTQEKLLRSLVTAEGVLLAKFPDGSGTWQVTLDRDTAAGCYELANIRPAGTDPATFVGGFAVTSDVRGLDLTNLAFVPDLANAVEGTFSRYQTIVLQFLDTLTRTDELALGTTQRYDLELRSLPLIDQIQDMMSSRDIRHYGADCLLKAPIPCFVQIGLTIHKQSGATDPDLPAIKDAIAAAVNTTGFTGRLYASTLQDAIATYIQAPTATGNLDLLGRLLYPSLAVHWLRSAEVLSIPEDAANMVGARTVQYFTSPEEITITVQTSVPTG